MGNLCAIYENVLSGFALTSLVAILETMGRLSVSRTQNVLGDLLVGDGKEVWLTVQKTGFVSIVDGARCSSS